MTKSIATPSRTKEILKEYGLSAKKGYGQNFLVDPQIVKRCVEEAKIDGAVIEIGPGIGSLTEALAKVAKKVVAYEIDGVLVEVLQDVLQDYDNIEIIHQDILEVDLKKKVKALKKECGSVCVCANLPYYITSPILFQLFEIEDIQSITVMMQKEVADRFSAKANDTEYSALSVEGQTLFEIKKLFSVPARSFNPSPAVDSTILRFERKEDISIQDIQSYFEFIRMCFKQRRKTIYNNLKEITTEKDLHVVFEEVKIEEKKRAQQLTLEELERLYKALYEG